jgi:hypothetical protein
MGERHMSYYIRRRHIFRQRSRWRNDQGVYVMWYHRLGGR